MAALDRGLLLKQIDHLFNQGTLTGLAEAQLLDRYLAYKDELAFEALVDRHGPMVLALCRRMLRDPKDIEDAFQATFLILVKKAPTIRDRQLLANWLYGVAYKVASRARRNRIRRTNRESSLETATLDCIAIDHSRAPEHVELAATLDQELARLPQKYRQPLILVYLDGRSQEQAAKLLGCPIGTVSSRMARGRALLKTRLTRRGYTPTTVWLGNGLTNSFPIISESVPTPLLIATVKAATQIVSTKIFQSAAIAGSVLSLTKGVLTTMQIAQYKWVAIGLLATTVSAGSVVAVGYASDRESGSQSGAPTAATAVPGESARLQQSNALPAINNPPRPAQDPFQPTLAEIKILSNRNDRIEALAARLEQALDQYRTSSSSTEQQSPETIARMEVLRIWSELREMARPLKLRLESFDEEVRRAMLDLGQARQWKEKTSDALRSLEAIKAKQPASVNDDSLARAKTEDNQATEVLTSKLEKLEQMYDKKNSDNVTLRQIERHLASLQRRIDRERNFGNPPLLPPDAPQHAAPPSAARNAAELAPAAAQYASKPSPPLDAFQSATAPPQISELFQNQGQRPAAAKSNVGIQMLILPLKQKLQNYEEAARAFAMSQEAASGLRRDQLRREITQLMDLLSALKADLQNELDQLKQEQQSALAEVNLATAKRRVSEITFLNTKRLFEDQKQIVSANEVARYESELNAASANVEIAKSNAKTPAIQISQLERKIASIAAIIDSSAITLNASKNLNPQRN